jgi:hypothetical protein
VGQVQMNTMLKLGSLAFNVAQDDKVKELFTMVHKGAKRRGMIGAVPPMIPTQSGSGQSNLLPTHSSGGPAIPFAPTAASPQRPQNVNKYLTPSNAKKVLGWASEISNLLIK